jgi:uncharacterized phage protein gp47/JayE
MSGVTATGWVGRTLQEILDGIRAGYTEQYGAGFILDESNVGMQQAAIFAKQLSDAWEGAGGAYYAKTPSTAQGKQLDEVSAITGATRQPATSSEAIVYGAGTPSTAINTGFTSSSDAGDFFETVNDFVLSAQGDLTLTSVTSVGTTATATLAGHPYIDGDVLFIEGATETEYNGLYLISNVTATTFDYIFAGSGTSPATGTIIAKYGTPITVFSQETGPIQALSGSITTIETTVSGLDQIENLVDATLGQEEETDSEFRERRVDTLSSLAGGTLAGIKANLLNVSGVSSAIVFENATGITVSGRPPYSIECFVTGGADQDIIDDVGLNKGGGIQAFGNTNGTYVDSDGFSHAIGFSRLSEVLIYVETTIVKNTDPDEGPIFDVINGPDNIKDAIVAYGLTLEPGNDVPVHPYVMAAIGAVEGVKDVTILFCDDYTPPDSDDPIVISATEIATFDTSRITVTVI